MQDIRETNVDFSSAEFLLIRWFEMRIFNVISKMKFQVEEEEVGVLIILTFLLTFLSISRNYMVVFTVSDKYDFKYVVIS